MTHQALKRVLYTNAAFSVLCAADMLIFTELLADFLGSFDGIYLQILAVGLIGFAGYVVWVARHNNVINLAKEIVLMDRLWVAGSALFIVFGTSWLSSAGVAVVVTVAIIVAIFAETQNYLIKNVTHSVH